MLKALLDRILELSEIRKIEYDGNIYVKNGRGDIGRLLLPNQIAPETLQFNNLTALVDYVDKLDFKHEKLFFAVKNPAEASLMASPDPENDNRQFKFATATLNAGDFRFGDWYDLETFIISLLGQFESTADRNIIIEMMGNLANEHVIQNKDDKFSQNLQVKTSLTTKANEQVENPVTLKPFRTFREVYQPESEFILRYQNRNNGIEAALFEGDGGQWKLDAISYIKKWFFDNGTIPVIG